MYKNDDNKAKKRENYSKLCKYCKSEIPKEAVFCAICGKQVEGRLSDRHFTSSGE